MDLEHVITYSQQKDRELKVIKFNYLTNSIARFIQRVIKIPYRGAGTKSRSATAR